MWGCIRAAVGIWLVFVSFSEVYGLVDNAAKHISIADGIDMGTQEPELGRHQKLAANAHSLPGSHAKTVLRSNVTVSSDEVVGSAKPGSVEVHLDTHGEEPRGCDSADVRCIAQAANSDSESGDTTWQGQQYINKLWRVTVLSCRFAPLFFTMPLAMTPLDDYWWDYFLNAFENSGPFYVKFGQWAATRDDLFPLFLTQRFARFHSHVKAHPIEVTHDALDRSFGPDWRKKLRLAEEPPVGSGCIAQVYRGKLQVDEGGDKDVAIKVVHPHVREQIFQDIDLAVAAGNLVSTIGILWLRYFPATAPKQGPIFHEDVDQFCTFLYSQTDLSVEVANMEKFRTNFADDDHIVVPEVFHRWATPNAFVMSFEKGLTLDELVGDLKQEEADEQKENSGSSSLQSSRPQHIVRKSTISKAEFADFTTNMFAQMLFVDNLVHADMHPGNILFDIKPPGRIVLLDSGLASSLSVDRAIVFGDLVYHLFLGDPRDFGMFLVNSSGVPPSEVTYLDEFCSRMQNLAATTQTNRLKLGKHLISELASQVIQLTIQYGVDEF